MPGLKSKSSSYREFYIFQETRLTMLALFLCVPLVMSTDVHHYCIHMADGVYVISGNCHQFIECSNGLTFILTCPPGSVFNTNINNCDRQENVPQCENSGMSIKTTTTTTTQQPTTRG